MSAAAADITLGQFAKRMAALLARPGVLPTALSAMRARREDPGSLCDFLEDNARRLGEAVALRGDDGDWTWRQANAAANRYARVLAGLGVRAGDAVAINMGNRAATLMVVWAVQKLGAAAAMLNTQQSGAALEHSLGLIRPRLIVVGEECLPAMQGIAARLAREHAGRLLFLADQGRAPVPPGYGDLAALALDEPDGNLAQTRHIRQGMACFYILTSGTTGLPKASIMSHLRARRAALFMGRVVMDLSPRDVLYCALPFYHNNAVMVAAGGALAGGATLAIARRFSASGFWDDCRRFEATAFCYIGEVLRFLLNQPPRANDREHGVIKIIGNGLRPELWSDFRQRFGIPRIHEFYGSSEGNGGAINLLNFERTCGFQPGAGRDWAIVDYDVDADVPRRDAHGRLCALGVGHSGLMIYKVSDKLPFDGYTDAAANESKLLRDVFAPGDCWFNTGDLLRRLPLGHLQFVDRVGDTFRWNGENVATTELEAVAMSWPPCADAVAYGVEVPDRDGRCGMLAVKLRGEARPDLDSLARLLRERLPRYAVPRFLRLLRDVELTGTFKHRKAGLKAQGYDPELIDEPLYFLEPGSAGFVPLDLSTRQRIDQGQLRL